MPWTVKDIPPQHGKLAIVTGANDGLGYDTSAALAAAGAEVIVAARNQERGEDAVRRIRSAHPQTNLRFEQLDLASLASVKSFADRVMRDHPKLDLLINNAGVMALPQRETTEDGFERQFGVNFLGHFALTALLLQLLRKAPAPRAVQLSSLAHRRGRIMFEDLQSERNYSPWAAYSQSKIAMLMFGMELGRRADAAGWNLLSTSAHPGWAHTSLVANGPGLSWSGRIVGWIAPLFSQTSEEGALPTLYAATASDVVQGGYYGPLGRGETKGPPGPAKMAPQALDKDLATRLWDTAEQLTGCKLQIA
jgi:NAD(P)-dependent dehydrogenase (short-subunit alcohol dehydrogenase family)